MRFRSFATVTSIAVLCSCTPIPQNTSSQTSEITALKNRLAALEQQNLSRSATADTTQLRNIARQQANIKAELDSLRVDLQSLTGRQEDQQHSLMQLREELTLGQNDLGLRVAALEDSQIKTSSVTTPSTAVQTAPPQQVTPPTAQPVITPPSAPQPEPEPVVQEPSAQNQPDELYHQALQLVQQGSDFTRSRELFRRFIQTYPQHELAVNALYWIGETLYGDKQYESAILQFQDVIQKYPNHPKIPAALTKQGLAFYALGDVRNAKIILQKVVDNYPQTPEADKAKERLASWQ
nr:tol-pal system protein YbgF [uncultured Desulfuromonas sp.]